MAIFEKVLSNISAVEQFVFEKYKMSFLSFLENTSEIKSAAIKRIYEKASTQHLKKWGITSEFSELTEEEKNRILEFDSGDIFLHFEFQDDKHWYEFQDEFELISKQMLADFVEDSDEGLVLKRLYTKPFVQAIKRMIGNFLLFNRKVNTNQKPLQMRKFKTYSTQLIIPPEKNHFRNRYKNHPLTERREFSGGTF